MGTTTTTYKIEWLNPENLEHIITGGARLVAALAKLAKPKQQFPKRGKSKRDLKKLGDEIDALNNDLQEVAKIMAIHVSHTGELAQAISKAVTSITGGFEVLSTKVIGDANSNIKKLITIVAAQDKRLKALEAKDR